MKRLVLIALFSLAACSQGAAPVIVSFTASPMNIAAGQGTTLAWTVTSATSIALNNGIGPVAGNSFLVYPTQTTTFTLTAASGNGRATADVVVTVGAALPSPVISSFTASPSSVPYNGTTTLSWVTSGATSLRLDPGAIDVSGQTQRLVTLGSADQTFTLTASNGASADATANLTVSVHVPGLHLTYTDPVSSTAKLLLVRDPASSTDSRVVLALKVGAQPITAFGFAIDLPLTPAGSTMVQLDPSLTPPGIVQNIAVLDPGANPITAGALITSPTAALADMLTIGVARHKQFVNDGDSVWPAGATVFSIALELTSAANGNNNVFNASAAAADKRYRAGAYKKADAPQTPTAAATGDVAIGSCDISL